MSNFEKQKKLQNQTESVEEKELHKTDPDAEKQIDSQSVGNETNFGKFKDAAELLKAYENLEREFTKKSQRLKELENRVYSENQTQLFIETPYRNNKMMEDIIKTCRPQTKLCIAANITCEGEYIKTRTLKEWNGKLPDLSKIPCIFLIYK